MHVQSLADLIVNRRPNQPSGVPSGAKVCGFGSRRASTSAVHSSLCLQGRKNPALTSRRSQLAQHLTIIQTLALRRPERRSPPRRFLPIAAAYRSLKIAQPSSARVHFTLPQRRESSSTFISDFQPSMAIFIFLAVLLLAAPAPSRPTWRHRCADV